MEYGTKGIKSEKLYLYQGFDPSNANVTGNALGLGGKTFGAVNQRDADLLFMWHRVTRTSPVLPFLVACFFPHIICWSCYW